MLDTIGTIMIVRIRIAANTFEPTVGFGAEDGQPANFRGAQGRAFRL
jgi:hypothetical protein